MILYFEISLVINEFRWLFKNQKRPVLFIQYFFFKLHGLFIWLSSWDFCLCWDSFSFLIWICFERRKQLKVLRTFYLWKIEYHLKNLILNFYRVSSITSLFNKDWSILIFFNSMSLLPFSSSSPQSLHT